MNLNEARTLAENLMTAHDLPSKGWHFEFNQAKRQFGLCCHGPKLIKLSAPLTEVNPEELVRDTILHEIAHALAGPGAGHGWRWKSQARKLGASDSRCSSKDTITVEGKYRATCPGCEKVVWAYRKRKRSGSCAACSGGRFNTNFRLEFEAV